MVGESGAVGGERGPSEALRQYAQAMAAEPGLDLYDVAAAREAFHAARRTPHHPPPLPPGGIASSAAWVKAFAAGTATKEQLAWSVGKVGWANDKSRARARQMLEHYDAWRAARIDPRVSKALIVQIGQTLRDPSTLKELKADEGWKLAALDALRQHPSLEVVAPRLFRLLLTPSYKAPEVSPPSKRVRRSQAAQSSRGGGGSGGSFWTWVFIIWLFSFAVRRCGKSETSYTPPPKPDINKRLEELRKRSRRLLEEAPRDLRNDSGDDERRGPGGGK